eukprot:g7032.t1
MEDAINSRRDSQDPGGDVSVDLKAIAAELVPQVGSPRRSAVPDEARLLPSEVRTERGRDGASGTSELLDPPAPPRRHHRKSVFDLKTRAGIRGGGIAISSGRVENRAQSGGDQGSGGTTSLSSGSVVGTGGFFASLAGGLGPLGGSPLSSGGVLGSTSGPFGAPALASSSGAERNSFGAKSITITTPSVFQSAFSPSAAKDFRTLEQEVLASLQQPPNAALSQSQAASFPQPQPVEAASSNAPHAAGETYNAANNDIASGAAAGAEANGAKTGDGTAGPLHAASTPPASEAASSRALPLTASRPLEPPGAVTGSSSGPRRSSVLRPIRASVLGSANPPTAPAAPPATRDQEVRDACRASPETRSEQQVDVLVSYVAFLDFFAQLDGGQQRALCRRMELVEYQPREYVFELGDYGDTFYIIFSGSVGVLVPENEERTSWRTEVFLDQGKCFGELARHRPMGPNGI